ncbi:hypothetical protein [Botrimarina hoheduenensis]|uniref:hypothetical protein n=1 Tax=Botrimarina hoheduenensis TaxID=2528000 RepID=UPI001E3B8C3D|nr:hypothetical protein [Botrimarina hoheduenensis]
MVLVDDRQLVERDDVPLLQASPQPLDGQLGFRVGLGQIGPLRVAAETPPLDQVLVPLVALTGTVATTSRL